jgi:hypothetical protein
MTTTAKVDAMRQDVAGAALDALGPARADHLVECERIHNHTLRLRTMIESWERDGVIGPDVAARALTPRSEQRHFGLRPPRRRGLLLWVGCLVAVPAPTVLLLIDAYVGPGSLVLLGLLVVVASPRPMQQGWGVGQGTKVP